MSFRNGIIYLSCWSISVLTAVALLVCNRKAYALTRRSYWRFLAQPWRIWTFALAATGLVLVAPYTGDPTWDYLDASVMALLTFATAPWAVGTFYRIIRRRETPRHLLVAANAWLLSASWSYDGYLFWRDGQYPVTFLFNLIASTVLYVLAGLFWSLDWTPEHGVQFAFMNENWPEVAPQAGFLRILGYALLFMLFAGGIIGYFVLDYLHIKP